MATWLQVCAWPGADLKPPAGMMARYWCGQVHGGGLGPHSSSHLGPAAICGRARHSRPGLFLHTLGPHYLPPADGPSCWLASNALCVRGPSHAPPCGSKPALRHLCELLPCSRCPAFAGSCPVHRMRCLGHARCAGTLAEGQTKGVRCAGITAGRWGR